MLPFGSEDGATDSGTSRSWRREGDKLSLLPPREASPADTFILAW